jgi:hypothetical protein
VIDKIIASIRMAVWLIRRIKLKKEFDALGEDYIVFLYCDPSEEVSMLEKFTGQRIQRVTVSYDCKSFAQFPALLITSCLLFGVSR